jgi:hypothetical protein
VSSNVSIGDDPGNEFSTLNDFLSFPGEVEKFLLTDISDFYNNIMGLDSPKLGKYIPNIRPNNTVKLSLAYRGSLL